MISKNAFFLSFQKTIAYIKHLEMQNRTENICSNATTQKYTKIKNNKKVKQKPKKNKQQTFNIKNVTNTAWWSSPAADEQTT